MAKKNTRKARTLDDIGGEVLAENGTELASVIRKGNLLNEANKLAEHGTWLPWLAKYFGRSERTARNYMVAARFAAAMAAKSATVAGLLLTPSALYLLASWSESVLDEERDNLVLKEAADKLVDDDRVREIWDDLSRARRKAAEAAQKAEEKEEEPETAEEKKARETREKREARRREIEADKAKVAADRAKAAADKTKAAQEQAAAILAGAQPALPAAQSAGPANPDLPVFDRDNTSLQALSTKALATFASTSHPPDSLRKNAAFLVAVADAIDKAAKEKAA
jgi:hypothetical protein